MAYNPGYRKFIEQNFKIVNKEQKLVPFKLNKAQKMYLEEGTGRDIILKARQLGFSSLILALFTVDFLTKENSRSIIIADSTENASELLDRVKLYIQFYEEAKSKELDAPFKVPLKYNSKNELFNELMMSRYTIGTANKLNIGRSKTITNLHLSEVAFYPNIQAIMTGVVQAVVPDGRIIFETTANGFNEFKDLWDRAERGEAPYKPLFFPPELFYDEKFLELKKRELGRLYQQEYPPTAEMAFVTSGDSIFDNDVLKWYLDHCKTPIAQKDGFRRYRRLYDNEFIVVAVDTAGGGGDYTAAQFLSKDRLDVPIVYQDKVSIVEATPLLYNALESVYKETGVPPVVTYERNNGGIYELERLKRLNKYAHYRIALMPTVGKIENRDPDKLGWLTNSTTRPKMLNDLKEAINSKLLTLYDKETVKEMFSFIEKRVGNRWKAEAENGAHDDLVMSLAIAYQLFLTETRPLNDYEIGSLLEQLPEEEV